MSTTIKKHTFSKQPISKEPCSKHIQLLNEKENIIRNLVKTDRLKLEPKIRETLQNSDFKKLERVSNRLTPCETCKGDCK